MSSLGSPTPNRDVEADYLAALIEEHATAVAFNNAQRAADVAEQLALRGHKV